MISISEEVTIPSPPDAVWPILRDPALVASCIPGATLTQSSEGGAYQGTMRVKFVPTIAIFRGEAKLAQGRPAPIPEEAELANSSQPSSAIADEPSDAVARTAGAPVAAVPLHSGPLLCRALLG
jgi:hypothetical protein